MVIYKAFDKLRNSGLGIFGKTPFRREGYLERLVGQNPAIVLDTSAIIDLESDDRNKKNKKGEFIKALDGRTRLFIPEEIYNECKIHNNQKLNSYVREISEKSFKQLIKLFENSKKIFEKYDNQYDDSLKYLACSLAKENQANEEEISLADYRLVGRSLELASLEDRQDWKGYTPSYVTVLTSDHHVDDMIKKAKNDWNIPRIGSFLTR